MRKGDKLQGQIGKAIKKLYANGSMKKILAKWKMSDFAVQK